MKKKQILSTRKRTAFRRILIGAAALLLVNHFLMAGLVFPIQALRRFEEREGTGRTRVVCREWEPRFSWNFLAYLTENENVTMLSGARLTYLGWMDAFGAAAVDCSEEAPVHTGWWAVRMGDKVTLYIFGRIDDPAIVRLKIQGSWVTFTEGVDLPTGQTEQEWTLGKKDWMEKDGRRYFLVRSRGAIKSSWDIQDFSVIGYDNDYCEVVRQELDKGSSAFLNK